MENEVEAFVRARHRVVFREAVKLFFGGRERVVALGVSFPQASQADLVGHIQDV